MRFSAITVFCLSLGSLHASDDVEAPWNRHTIDLESGILWQFGHNTSLPYRNIPTQLSWRSPYMFKKDLDNGSTLVLRNQVSLIGTWIEAGPENRYFGASAAPSLEWWSPKNKWSVYLSVGGGIGVIDSTYVKDAQGQDFTLNWFAKTGVRYQIDRNVAVFGGPMFQHMSNGGATDPNPGIDSAGFSVGASFSF